MIGVPSLSKPLTVIFAGGGSGGHISPGLAIAERLGEIAPRITPLFVCSTRMIDATMLGDAGAEYVPVPATPPSVRPAAALRFFINFRRSKRMIQRLIRERNVIRVVTLGGFVAAPAVSAANSLGVAVMLVNLDAPPGKANRWMARRSDAVISAMEVPTMPGFASKVVGMPIRRRAVAQHDQRTCRARLGLDADAPTLLVTGASQGATSVNAFLAALAATHPEMFRGWQVYHLAGHGADEPLRKAYAAAGMNAKVEPFLNEMGLAWGAADLAISRAGANSVAEAAANSVPTLFLPYPYHKDMHQKHNAQPLVDLGGAVMAIDMIDAPENVRTISPLLRELMMDAGRRSSMRDKLKANPLPDAAAMIAKLLVSDGGE